MHFRGRAVQETCSSEMLGGQGADFLRGACILEHQIFSFGKMILCDKCSTLYDLASLFRGRRNTSETWTGKIAKGIGTRPSALQLSLLKEVSQNCFVFDVCQLQKLRKYRRIASFLMLPTSKIEEVSQNCFLFDVIKFKSEELSQNCFVLKLADCR